ncbi:MAG: peptidyl-prolyl cis-trans isomerase [Deltaproteobacteria bacterium]|nr:peptidyl-prolyl cis-trans isomerase [Deltaproteobacteria bacterium]
MTEELEFNLPTHKQPAAQSQSKLVTVLMFAVLIAVLVNIGIVLLQKGSREKRHEGAALSAEQQKHLALKLEKQGLNRASVEAWKEYLPAASPDNEDAARVWYRIGKLYQMENQYDMALNSFYRSESFAKPEDISAEIARRTQECLEAMGKFAALRYELADRVGSGIEAASDRSACEGDRVVAEIGPQKIMKSDLDRRIEHVIETQISQFSTYLPEEQVNKRKEELLKQYSTDNQRRFFLNQYVMEEVLYWNARESRLMDDAEVRTALKDMERSFLARKVIEKELSDEIKITAGDLETYFEAHKHEYVHPERARISHILVDNKQAAQAIRKKLESGDDFAKLAADMSRDVSTREKGGNLPEWIEKNESGSIPGMGNSKDAMRVIFSTDEGSVSEEDVDTEKGIHIIKVLEREPEHQKTFEEVQNEVFLALRSQKEREVQQKLLAMLKEKYDVVIHHSALAGKDESTNSE